MIPPTAILQCRKFGPIYDGNKNRTFSCRSRRVGRVSDGRIGWSRWWQPSDLQAGNRWISDGRPSDKSGEREQRATSGAVLGAAVLQKAVSKGPTMPDAHPANIDIDAALEEAEEHYR